MAELRDSRTIRVLYCTGDFSGGGTQQYLLNLVRGLDRRRFDVTVACLVDRGSLSAAMHQTGVRIESLRIDRPLWHPRSLRAIVGLSNRMRGRFDVVHTLLGHANVVGLLAAGLAGHRRVLASQRSLHPVSGSFRSSRAPLVALARLLFRRVASRVVVNNPAISEALAREGVASERIVLIPNGIDTARFRPHEDRRALRSDWGIPSDSSVIGFVGRMIPEKGLGRAIGAAQALIGRVPTLRLVAVGDGPAREGFERSVADGPLRGRADFVGFREDGERLYPLFDVLAFPSTYSEGTPNVVLEAMACGVPPVVHRMRQTEHIVQHGVTGILVDAESTPSLAAGLEQVLLDSGRAAAIGRAARAYVCAEHSLEAMLRATERLYEEEMDDAGAATA